MTYDLCLQLQGLDKSEVIADVGSRSFYLRKNNDASSTLTSSFHWGSAPELATHTSTPSIANPPLLIPSFIARRICKIVRRAHRLWKILVCSQWGHSKSYPPPQSIIGKSNDFFSVAFQPFISTFYIRSTYIFMVWKYFLLL